MKRKNKTEELAEAVVKLTDNLDECAKRLAAQTMKVGKQSQALEVANKTIEASKEIIAKKSEALREAHACIIIHARNGSPSAREFLNKYGRKI